MINDNDESILFGLCVWLPEFIISCILCCTPRYYAVTFSFTDGVVGFIGGLLFGVFVGLFYSLFAMVILILIVLFLIAINAIYNIFN